MCESRIFYFLELLLSSLSIPQPHAQRDVWREPPAEPTSSLRPAHMLILLQTAFLSAAALSRPTAAAPPTDFGRLVAWVRANGGDSNVLLDTQENGLRGLVVADHACAVGDVLLEVPLSLVIADGESEKVPLQGSSPKWSWSLPWNVS